MTTVSAGASASIAAVVPLPDEEEHTGNGCCAGLSVASLRRPVEVEHLSYDSPPPPVDLALIAHRHQSFGYMDASSGASIANVFTLI